MSATAAFAHPVSFAGRGFSSATRRHADQLFFEPEVKSENCFEGIVGKSMALQRVLQQVAIVAPDEFRGAPSRGNRNRQGIDCPCHSQPQLPARSRLCADELRCHASGPIGKRTVRS
jgi:hypothetical protein